MSNYGDFSLSLSYDTQHFREKVFNAMVDFLGEENSAWLQDIVWDQGWASICWYDHEQDMRSISLKFPSTVFTLMVVPEEYHGEVRTRKYFKNGMMQVSEGKITYDEFDPERVH